MSHSHKEHRAHAPRDLGFYVITVSTSRFEKSKRKEPIVDESGDVAKQLIISSGNKLEGYSLIPDDKLMILKAVVDALCKETVDVVVTTGGTGFTPSDMTVETLRGIFDREVEGFGQVFRYLSFSQEEVKSASYLSKATAGIIKGKLIYVLPGSPDAVKLAMSELVLPEAGHLIYLARSEH